MMESLSNYGLERDHKDLVLRTTQQVLIDVFGERSFKKMLRIMKENYSLEWDDIAEKSQVFSQALRKILGMGSMIIEDLIIENLYIELGLELSWKKGFSFSDYIAELPSVCKPASQH